MCFIKNTVRDPDIVVGDYSCCDDPEDAENLRLLQSIAWWDWPIDKVTRHLAQIASGDVEALRAAAQG